MTSVKSYVEKCEKTWAAILGKMLNPNAVNVNGYSLPVTLCTPRSTPERYNTLGCITYC